MPGMRYEVRGRYTGRAGLAAGWPLGLVCRAKLWKCGDKICQPLGEDAFRVTAKSACREQKAVAHNSGTDEQRADLRTAEVRLHWFLPTCRIVSRITMKARGQRDVPVSLSLLSLVWMSLHADRLLFFIAPQKNIAGPTQKATFA